jgi:hypothetical protein
VGAQSNLSMREFMGVEFILTSYQKSNHAQGWQAWKLFPASFFK